MQINTNIDSPVDKLTGGITTPPRKKSFGVTNSPKIHRADPFKIQNINLNEEVTKKREEAKQKQEQEDEGEYEEEEEEVEEEEEEEETKKQPEAPKSESIKTPQRPPQNSRVAQNRPVPPPVRRQGSSQGSEKAPQRGNPPIKSNAPPIVRSRQPPPVASRDPKQPDRRREPPPMKTRKDEDSSAPKPSESEQKVKKDTVDDRSKTPQPSTSSNNTLNPGRISRFSRETDEPPVTHAVVRDKSIGERLRSTLLPGFLGGGSTSTVAVTKADHTDLKKSTVSQPASDLKSKPPKAPQAKNDPSAFEGLFDRVLGLLGRKKQQTKQPFVFSDDDDDDIPPPPKTIKKKPEGKADPKSKGGKGRLANRYASTFDTTQLAPEIEGINLPTPEPKPFTPPPLDAPPAPSTFQPTPAQTNSPKGSPMVKKIHNEKALEKVRQDTTSLPKFEERKSEQDEEYVKINESENEEVEIGQEGYRDQEEEEEVEVVVSNENYEKAYNQLKNYKTENKALKRQIIADQARAEMNIDYFVQLCEDVKYKGLEELETYKNRIQIMRGEQKRFIDKQAEHLCLINKLETEIKFMKIKEDTPPFRKPYTSPQEAKQGLKQGLDELKNLQMVLEQVNAVQVKIHQKDRQIKNILSEILRNVDENSEQGQILLQNMDGEYDIETIRAAIHQIFEHNSKQISEVSKKMESDFASQIAKMGEDSRYKEERINELIKDGLLRARTEEEQSKQFVMLQKDNEEKDDRIQELEDEVRNLKQNHRKIEEQFETRFQEILEESQIERDEWLRSGTMTEEESSNMKAEIEHLRDENERLKEENLRYTDSYRIMEAEFTQFEEDNNAMRNTIHVLERELMRRNEILEQYELGNDEIIEENQEKVKELIDKNIEVEHKYDDLQSQFVVVCDYLKDIYNTMRSEDNLSNDDDIDKSVDMFGPQMTEEEIEELYNNILNLYQTQKQDMESK